jgi:putative effector of murein hydrolase
VLSVMIAGLVFRLFRIHAPQAQGCALGLTAHGIGIGRALQISESAAAFAGVAMGLNGLITSLWAPFLVPWLLDGG